MYKYLIKKSLPWIAAICIPFFLLGCERCQGGKDDAGVLAPAPQPLVSNAALTDTSAGLTNAPTGLDNSIGPITNSISGLSNSIGGIQNIAASTSIGAASGGEIDYAGMDESALKEQERRLLEDLAKVRLALNDKKSADKPAVSAPVKIIPIKAKTVPVSTDKIDISWDAAPAASGIAFYNVYRNGEFVKKVNKTSFSQSNLKPDTSYCFIIRGVDKGGRESGHSEILCARTLAQGGDDNKPPTAPQKLSIKKIAERKVDLSWAASADNVAVEGYNIYQNGALIVSVSETFAALLDLSPNQPYCYVVTAYDAAGNESSHSNKVCQKSMYEDTTRPTTPTGLTVSSVAGSSGVDLSWSDSRDDVAVAGYNVYMDGAFLKTTASASSLNVEIKGENTRCFSVSALDNAGNESRKSQQVCVFKKTGERTVKNPGGSVWSGGLNNFGQLGNGNNNDLFTLVMLENFDGTLRVDSSVEHTLVLKVDGTVWAWGRNDKGQLGNGTTKNSAVPVQVKGLKDVVDISAGWYHSVALRKDGTVWAWGRNYYGQLGNGNFNDSLTPVRVQGLDDVVDVVAGWYHTLAIKEDGTVWAWGWNFNGQLGDGTKNTSSYPQQVVMLTDIEHVSCGMYHSLALKKDGTVWAWGYNEFGQLGTGEIDSTEVPVQLKGIDNVEFIDAGMNHSVALKRDGSVWAWGRNEYGQIGRMTGALYDTPVKITEISGINEIAAGAYHTVALKRDGTVWAWGWKLNNRFRINEAIPVQISGLWGIVDIAAGRQYTVVVRAK